MSNVLSEEKRKQVIALGQLGWATRRIEAETGVRRETISGYLKEAGVAVRRPRGRRLQATAGEADPALGEQAKPASQVSTDPEVPQPEPASQVSTDPGSSAAGATPAPGRSACEPFREMIEQRLSIGRNAVAIWQELIDEHGFSAAYASVKRFVVRVRARPGPEAHPVILTEPGHEAQVDYGSGPMVRDPATGKYRRTRLFVMTLGYSRKAVRLLVFHSGVKEWARLHELAFRRLGGVPRMVVLDNLREGVIKPDVYDPEVNPVYRDMLAHYGVTAWPCRVRHANRKGKVESAVGHTKRTALRGLRFESLEAAQAYLDHWNERWADTRIHGTTKRQVAAMFAEERPALQPLPLEPFRYYQFGSRTVHMDGTIQLEGAFYMVPPGRIGRTVAVQWDELHVRILDPLTHELLREHLIQQRGRYRVHPDDKPARTPATTEVLLSRAAYAGRSIGTLCEQLHRDRGELGVRGILGVLALAKKHGACPVELACKAALELGVPTYRFVRGYLEHQAPPLTLRQIDPLIRDLTHYRDVITQLTKEDS